MSISRNSVMGMMGVVAFLATACGGAQPAPSAPASGAPAAAPLAAVPAPYAGKTSPVATDPAAIEAGKKIYTTNCVSCHGESGHGDGVAASALEPKPRNLTDQAYVATLSDDRMFWRISEGGPSGPAGSAMPPWKSILKEEEIWQTVAYIRSLSK